MVGYGEYEPLGEDPYGEAELNGYVRPSRMFNPGCPLPTNVAGFAESSPLEGYAPPRPVSPRVTNFVPPAAVAGGMPDTFRPLW